MKYELQSDSGALTVRLSGDLTYKDASDFHNVLRALQQDQISKCDIDLSGLQFIDSTGLSLLLLASDVATARKFQIRLTGAQGMVQENLQRTHFHTIVTIA